MNVLILRLDLSMSKELSELNFCCIDLDSLNDQTLTLIIIVHV